MFQKSSTEKPSVVVGAVLLPELDEASTEPVGEACRESVSLDEVVIGAEAADEAAAVVCGKAQTGTSKELNAIVFARMLKEVMVARMMWQKNRKARGSTKGGRDE
jgi:hypothetical protein